MINNAGIVHPVGALRDQDPLAVAKAISLNVAAPLMLAAAVVRAAPDGCLRRRYDLPPRVFIARPNVEVTGPLR